MLWEGSDLPGLVNFAETALGARAITGLRKKETENPNHKALPLGAGWVHTSCHGSPPPPPPESSRGRRWPSIGCLSWVGG